MPAAGKKPKINSREELILALHAGAEVEHLLLCEYLYAGWSVRRSLADFPPVPTEGGSPLGGGDEAANRVLLDRVRPWLAQVYTIARQEMEHLGIVCNLLAAVDAEPYFDRRPFPQPTSRSLLDAPFGLDRFGLTSLRRFVWYERPDALTPSYTPACEGLEEWQPEGEAPLPVHALEIYSIGDLYQEISHAFGRLPPEEIFLGNPERQLGDEFSFKVKMAGVGNRDEAWRAIHQIVVEGEGIGLNPLTSTSHFQRFTQILTELEEAIDRDPHFSPALPVLTNPLAAPHPAGYPASVVVQPEALAVMRFFNDVYHAMLVMLKTFFATYSRSYTPAPRGQTALFYAAFFPLMTMALRPLGEILARMPAGDEFPGQNAGASFEIGAPVEVQTDPDWHCERLASLAARAKELMEAVPDRMRPVMQEVYEGLTSTGLHVGQIWKG